MPYSSSRANAINEFLNAHQLDENYIDTANRWFAPITEQIASQVAINNRQTIIIGVTGSQGSGKSTLAAYLNLILTDSAGLRCTNCSLDDFYLRRSERLALAKTIHPLLATRGVPGTHDTKLAIETLQALKNRKAGVSLPRFDKSIDDRSPISNKIDAPLDVVIFEGWCLGADTQADCELNTPINDLERIQDSSGKWRTFVNHQLQTQYAELFSIIDNLIMLRAPSFQCVFDWRLEQERKLAKTLTRDERTQASRLMSAPQIREFIQHYQRITERLIAYPPVSVQHLFDLDNQRNIVSHTEMPPHLNKDAL